jgi:hypothetical protein
LRVGAGLDTDAKGFTGSRELGEGILLLIRIGSQRVLEDRPSICPEARWDTVTLEDHVQHMVVAIEGLLGNVTRVMWMRCQALRRTSLELNDLQSSTVQLISTPHP